MNSNYYFITKMVLHKIILINFIICISINHSIGENLFTIVDSGKSCSICVDVDADKTVQLSAQLLAEDIERVCGVKPAIIHDLSKVQDDSNVICIGEIGKSKLLDTFTPSIPIKELEGEWERFCHKIISNPASGSKALIIAGSDRRGTAYGVLEISKKIGVSPWYWWADVEPEQKEEIIIHIPDFVSPGPAIKYRGIFINDEDVFLRPWGSNFFNEEGLGPKVYEKIFELMLRLRANYLWPGMHNHFKRINIWEQPPHNTKPFYYMEGNKEMADKYAIVMGTSHHEPLHRNTLYEWAAENHSVKFDYYNNKELFIQWLEKRVEEVKDCENLYTLAMRGGGDTGIKVPEGVDVLEVVQDGLLAQRQILEDVLQKPASQIPQIFVAYADVLKQLEAGLEIPDDVIIVWPDNNRGTMRAYPNKKQQKHPAGHGLYYHFQHLGPGLGGRNTWLSSTPLDLIVQEHQKALDTKIDKLWIVNVGDIKHHEKELEFYMDLAWNPKPWTKENAMTYYKLWSARTFGSQTADQIATVQSNFIDMVRFCLPEFIDGPKFQFPRNEEIERTKKWKELIKQTDSIYPLIPERLQDAFFQLIAYPIKATANLHLSRYLANRSRELAEQNSSDANKLAREAYNNFFNALELAKYFNTGIKNGKWNKITGISNFIPYRPPIVGWHYETEPLLPELKLSNAIVRAPMKLIDNKLCGTANKRCTLAEGGMAQWTFSSNIDGFVKLAMYLDCPTVNNDSQYITFNGKTSEVEWLINEEVENLGHGNKRKKGPLWQTVLLLDLKKGENTLTLHQCEPIEILDIKLQPISI